MSIISSLLLVLLWFYFHACDARSFGVLHNETAKEFHHKENEKLNPARVSIQPDRKASIPNANGDAKEESSTFEKHKVINSESNHEPRTRIDDQAKGDYVKISGTPESDQSLASVSWRVPHKKRGDPEPGFNLDYLPPKTHPPVHN